MSSRVPEYCFNCGNKLEHEKFILQYREDNGEPVYRIRVKCLTCKKNGEMVYFQQCWRVPKKTATGNIGADGGVGPK